MYSANAMGSFFRTLLFTFINGALSAQLRNTTVKSLLRGGLNASWKSAQRSPPPCQCEANNPAWKPTARTVPKCVFIDLGAADGNSFQNFLSNGYGPVANCPSGQWEAILIEANPHFTPALNNVAYTYPGAVHAFGATAAYMCQGITSFSVDPNSTHNHWGSSMKRQLGSATVTVPTVNVAQVIAENVMPGDWVMLKIDIEGAEYDVLPCLANFPKANLVDVIYVEEHGYLQTNSIYTPQQYQQSKAVLKSQGILMPDNFHSQTL